LIINKFFIANTISIVLNLGLLYILVEFTSINDLISKAMAGVIVGLFNFTLNKFWTFKQTSQTQQIQVEIHSETQIVED